MKQDFLHEHDGTYHECSFTHFQLAHMLMVTTPWGSRSRSLSGSTPEAVARALATELVRDYHSLKPPV
jgi:hypothetical protein